MIRLLRMGMGRGLSARRPMDRDLGKDFKCRKDTRKVYVLVLV